MIREALVAPQEGLLALPAVSTRLADEGLAEIETSGPVEPATFALASVLHRFPFFTGRIAGHERSFACATGLSSSCSVREGTGAARFSAIFRACAEVKATLALWRSPSAHPIGSTGIPA